MEPLSGCDLRGAGLLVTRAAHQAEPLCRLIEAQGGRALRLPALEILPPSDLSSARRALAAADAFDIAIFISPNAVARALPLLPSPAPLSSVRLAAVGRATARALAAAGHQVSIVPEQRYDSEALLAAPGLQTVHGLRILILKGENGRPILAQALAERGAEVVTVDVYRRHCPESDPLPILLRWQREVAMVLTTSQEVLDNLVRILGEQGRPLLVQTPLVVVSERMRERARALGCRQLVLAKRADDRSLVEAACRKLSG